MPDAISLKLKMERATARASQKVPSCVHEGKTWAQLPEGYLKHLSEHCVREKKEAADLELWRRAEVMKQEPAFDMVLLQNDVEPVSILGERLSDGSVVVVFNPEGWGAHGSTILSLTKPYQPSND